MGVCVWAFSPLSAEAGIEPAKNVEANGDGADSTAPHEQIDRLIEATLSAQGIEPNAAIDDAIFLRRAYLTIGGRIPTLGEAEAFHAASGFDKREALISSLLKSEAYVSNFYHFWADLLRVNGELDGPNRTAYELWLKQALRDNKRYDELVYSLVTATGTPWDNGATGYYFRDRGMSLDNMSNTVRLFLGTRLECAQCHNHPFDKWTQMDYFQMAAFSYGMSSRGSESENRRLIDRDLRENRKLVFAEATGIEGFPNMSPDKVDAFLENPRKSGWLEDHGLTETEFRALVAKGKSATDMAEAEVEGMKEVVKQLYQPLKYSSVDENVRAQVKLPHDYQYSDAEPLSPVAAKTMFGADIDAAEREAEGVTAYARWMTSPENPTFTRVIVNRLWKEVFGIALIEPLDELTDQTQPSHPELLDYLEQLMRELDYDMQAFLAVLYNTRTFQRAADSNEIVLGMPYYFPGPLLRRMSAEQIWDSVVALTVPEVDRYRPEVTKNLQGLERQRLIYESLEGRTPEEFMAMLKQLAPLVGDTQPNLDKVREQILEARNAGDDELAGKLKREFAMSGKEMKRTVSEVGYHRLSEQRDDSALLALVGLAAEGSAGQEANTLTELPAVTPASPADTSKSDTAGADRRQMSKDRDKSERRGNRDSGRKQLRGDTDYQQYHGLVNKMARASELESPAPRGHFLRDFGQSDREMIENAADNASVPQALNLLNGTVAEALTNRYSVFGSRLHEAGSVKDKAGTIFQAMLGRQPTANEIALVSAEVEQSEDADAAYEGVVWALLNTQQFLFVN